MGYVLGILAIVAGALSLPAAYVTHIAWAVRVLSADAQSTNQMILACLGFIPPVGIIHGFILWF